MYFVYFLALLVTGGSNGNEQEDSDQNNVKCKLFLFIYMEHYLVLQKFQLVIY